MCGLVGVSILPQNGFFKKPEDVFKQLLYADVVRGEDSTGIVMVENNGGFSIAKEASEATYFQYAVEQLEGWKRLWKNGKAIIGHNRKQTSGKVCDENAHPFVIDETMAAVHNGTLYNHKKLANTDVDSEALFTHLKPAYDAPEEEQQEKFKTLLADVSGAYATVSFHQPSNSIYFLRNTERPLTLMKTYDAYYWASEAGMLWWILTRNGYTKENITILEIKPHVLYKLSLSNNVLTEVEVAPKKHTPPTTKKIGTEVATDVGISKNEFKRLRKKFIGTRCTFWVDYALEAAFPKTVEDGENLIDLYGDVTSVDVDNWIACVVDIKELGITKEEAQDKPWSGLIQEMDWSPVSKKIRFHIAGAFPLPPTLAKKIPSATQIAAAEKDFQRKLIEKDLHEASASIH